MVKVPILLGRTTTCPNRHIALSNTLSLEKYWWSLVATLTCPTADTTAAASRALPGERLPSSSGGVNDPNPRSATGDRPNKPPSFASCVAACGGDVTGTDGALDLSAQYDLCPVTGEDFHCSSSYVSDGETMPQWITDLRPVCVGRG